MLGLYVSITMPTFMLCFTYRTRVLEVEVAPVALLAPVRVGTQSALPSQSHFPPGEAGVAAHV